MARKPAARKGATASASKPKALPKQSPTKKHIQPTGSPVQAKPVKPQKMSKDCDIGNLTAAREFLPRKIRITTSYQGDAKNRTSFLSLFNQSSPPQITERRPQLPKLYPVGIRMPRDFRLSIQ